MFSFELQFLKFLESLRTDFLDILFQGITILGEETLMILLVVTLWFAVNRREAQKVLFITAGSLCVNGIIKNLVKMPRPFTRGISCVRGDTATGYSFPSGHSGRNPALFHHYNQSLQLHKYLLSLRIPYWRGLYFQSNLPRGLAGTATHSPPLSGLFRTLVPVLKMIR